MPKCSVCACGGPALIVREADSLREMTLTRSESRFLSLSLAANVCVCVCMSTSMHSRSEIRTDENFCPISMLAALQISVFFFIFIFLFLDANRDITLFHI